MIKSTSEAIGTGINRVITGRSRRVKPISAIFPGSFSTFDKPLGEMKVVKKTYWGLLGNYTRYVKEFVPYEEDDFIDNKVLNGGGGSGVLVATPLPKPPSPPPEPVVPEDPTNVQWTATLNSLTLTWNEPDITPDAYLFYLANTLVFTMTPVPGFSYTFEDLQPGSSYSLGIQAKIGTETSNIVTVIGQTTSSPPPYVVPPIQGLKVDEIFTNSVDVSWDLYPDDPENPTYKFLTFINGEENKYIDPTTSFAFPGLSQDTDYALGIQVVVLHEGVETMSTIETVEARTLVDEGPL